MSARKKDAAQPQKATAALAETQPQQILAVQGAPATQIPMGMRDDIAPAEIDDAPPSGAAQSEVVQSSPSDSAKAEVADAPPSGPAQTGGEDLEASFTRQYKTVCKIDVAVAHFEIKRRRTLEYWELGRIATELKKKVGHGNWGAFLKGKYAERTIQRAMLIHGLFHDRKDDCAGLTLAQALEIGRAKKSETEPSRQAVPASPATEQQKTIPLPEVTDDGDEAKGEEDGQQEASSATGPQDAAPTAEVAGDSEAQGDEDDQDEDDAREEKNELLWGIAAEATDPGFAISDAEREAFAVFMAAVGDEGRAVRVLLHSIWNII